MYDLLGNLQWPVYVGILLWATIKYPRPRKDKILLWIAFVIARFWGAIVVPVLYRVTGGIIPEINLGVGFGFIVLMVAAIAYCLTTVIRAYAPSL